MEMLEGIEIYDLSLYLVKSKTLVISDIHLGYEEALNVRGVLIPRIQYKDTHERIENILKNLKVETIIVTGDFKHEFGVISETEWRNILQIIDLFFKYSKRVIVIKGNHDVNLGPIASKRKIELVDYFKIDDILICHGDEVPEEDISKQSIIIIGHEHAAVGLKENNKYEIYKCFLKGIWEGRTLIAMPSFNVLTTGTDIIRHERLSPFLKQDLSNFEVYIADKKTYYFGKIKDMVNL